MSVNINDYMLLLVGMPPPPPQKKINVRMNTLVEASFVR